MFQVIVFFVVMLALGLGFFESIALSFAVPIVILFIYFGYKAIFDKD